MASSVTTSEVRAEVQTGSHLFKISGYSLTKGIGTGKFICSDVFNISGYKWIIRFYPDGDSINNKDFISFFLELKSHNYTGAKARFTFTILQQDGVSSIKGKKFEITSFNYINSTWGMGQFAKRSDFEASKHLKDDAFTIKCTVTVVKENNLQGTTPYGIAVPTSNFGIAVPTSNLNQHFVHLLENGDGADITFIVKGERFKANRCVLAARSAVFNAELFGCMKEKGKKIITIKDIDAPIFKAMLYFIYSDSVPDFEGNSDDYVDEKKDVILMAQHLLAAADRYDLERLKLMCEDFLWKNLNVSTVVSTLIMAEQHNCNQLEAECLRFMRYPVNFKAVALTDEFDDLETDFPSILKKIELFNLKMKYYSKLFR